MNNSGGLCCYPTGKSRRLGSLFKARPLSFSQTVGEKSDFFKLRCKQLHSRKSMRERDGNQQKIYFPAADLQIHAIMPCQNGHGGEAERKL